MIKSSNTQPELGVKRILTLILLILLITFTSSCKNSDVKNKSNSQLEITASIGYNGVISLYGGNPVKFDIKNNGGDFNGEIKIDVPLNGNEIHQLIIPVEIAAGSEKSILHYVELKTLSRKFKYHVFSGIKEVAEGDIACSKFINPINSNVAVVCDNPDNYRFVNGANIKKIVEEDDYFYQYQEQFGEESIDIGAKKENNVVYFKDVKEFEDPLALQYFDYVFIGDSSNLKFSDKSAENFEKWIENHKVLILETGSNYSKMDKQIPESLKVVDFNSCTEANYDLSNLSLPFRGKIMASTGNLIEGSAELNRNNHILGYIKPIGSGKILCINTMLNEADVSNWNINGIYLSYLLQESGALSKSAQFNEEGDYYRISDMVSSVPVDLGVSFSTMALILFLYILISGPIAYFILKKMDKRTLMWITGPALALIVIFSLAFVGRQTWGNKPIANEASKIVFNQGEDLLNIETAIGIFNNKKGDLEIKSDPFDNFSVVGRDDYHYHVEEEEKKRVVSASKVGLESTYYSYDTSLWNQVAALASKSIKLENPEVYGALKTTDEGNVFEFKVNLPLEMKHAILSSNGLLYYLGDIKSGELNTYKLDDLKSANHMYGLDLQDDENLSQFERVQIRRYMNAYESFFERYMRHGGKGMDYYGRRNSVIAYNTEKIGYNLEINEKEPVYFDTNVISINFDMEYEKNKAITLKDQQIRSFTYSMPNPEHINAQDYNSESYALLPVRMRSDAYNFVSFDMDNYDIKGSFSTESRGYLEGSENHTTFNIPEDMDVSSVEIDFNQNTEETYQMCPSYDMYMDMDDGSKNNHVNVSEVTEEKDIDSTEINETVIVGDKPLERYFIYNYKTAVYDEITFEGKDLLDDKIYKIDLNNNVNELGEISICILKDKYITGNERYASYEIKQNKITVKGVFHD